MVELRKNYINVLGKVHDEIGNIVCNGIHDVFPEPIDHDLLELYKSIGNIMANMDGHCRATDELNTLEKTLYNLNNLGYEMPAIISKVQEIYLEKNKGD